MTEQELEDDLTKAILAHEAEYGVFQEGDTVRDKEGRLWQLQKGRLVKVRPH